MVSMTNTHKLSRFGPKWWCGNNLGILVMRDPPLVVPLGFEFQSCCDDTHSWSGGIWMCRVFFAAGSAQSMGHLTGDRA